MSKNCCRCCTVSCDIIHFVCSLLDEFGAYPAVAERELRRTLPFLASTKILVAAVKAGMGREAAHEVIKGHAVAVALAMREQALDHNDLLERLAADERMPLDLAALNALISDPLEFTGDAGAQVDRVIDRIEIIAAAHPTAADYNPAPIL